MSYPTLSEGVNTTEGLHTVLVYTNRVTNGLFTPMLLFTIFIIVALGTYFSSKRLSGDGNFPSSFAVAGFITVGASFIMMLIPNLISTLTVVITITIATIGALWLLFDSRS